MLSKYNKILLTILLTQLSYSQNLPPEPSRNLKIVARSPLNTNIKNLGDNSWLEIIPETSFRYVPRNYEPSDVLEEQPLPQGRAYSPPIIGANNIFYFGGGHHSHPGNDVEMYDIFNNIWIQLYKPEVCARDDEYCNKLYGGGGSGVITPSGRPYTEHLWQGGAYRSEDDLFYCCISNGFWSFDYKTGSWNQIVDEEGAASLWAWRSPNLFDYDPDLGAFPLLIADYQLGAYTLTIDGQYAYRGELPESQWGFLHDVYIADLKIHFVLGWNKFWKYNAVDNSWILLEDIPSDAGQIDSYAYDSLNKVVVCIIHHDSIFKVYIYDIFLNTWTVMPNQSELMPEQNTGKESAADMLMYNETNNIFFFLQEGGSGGGTGGKTKLWAYRYKN